MQAVSSSAAQTSGQPLVSARPGHDNAGDVFAGLLAALSGVTAFPAPLLPPAPAVPASPSGGNPDGPVPAAAQPASGDAGGPAGGAAAGPVSPGPAGVLTVSTQAVLTAAGSPVPATEIAPPGPVADGTAQAPAAPAGQLGQVPPVVAVPVPAGDPSTSGDPSTAGDPVVAVVASSGQAQNAPAAPAALAAPVTGSGRASNGATGQAPPTAPQATPVIGANQPGTGPVTGEASLRAQIPAAAPKVAAGTAAPTPPQAASGGVSSQSPVIQGYAPGTDIGNSPPAATQPTPVQGSNPATAPPAAVPGAGNGSNNSQFTADGGSSGGSGTGGNQTSPPAGSPVPVLLPASSASWYPPVVAAASLPHDAAQAILSYLNQGGRLPARLQLQLDPPALGKMTVHLALDAGTLSVTFVTASSHARDAVAAGLPQMRELLDRNNLVLGHTGVYVGTQSGGRGNAGGNPGFARQGGTDTRMPASPAAEENQSQSRSGSSLLNILV